VDPRRYVTTHSLLGIDADRQSGFASSNQDHVGSGPGAGLGSGAGLGAGSAQNQNFGAEHSSVHLPLNKKDVADEQVHHGDSYGSRGSGLDKTGHLDQDAHKYESTGAGGPTTGGAANTDKFDTDRSGATGNSYGATDSYPDLEHTKSRKGTGGIGGIVSQPSLCTYAH
jgi:hypothetical protein